MAKRIITEADVVEAAAASKGLRLPPGQCIVTDQARDRAQELGVELLEDGAAANGDPVSADELGQGGHDQLVRQVCEVVREKMPPSADPAQVERLVREAIASRRPPAVSPAAHGGVVLIESGKALGKGAGSVPTQDRAVLTEVLGPPGESRLAAGYLAWEGSSFNRVVEAPEVGIVIEGELHLTVEGHTIIGRPGDMIYLPQGAKVVYSAPAKVKLACVNGVS